MKSTSRPAITPGQLVSTLRAHPMHWLLPTVVCGALAAAYALVRPDTWEASQALIVRNEAAASQDAPGKVLGAEEMKTLQATILELVRSRGVLAAALAEVGPGPEARASAFWPGEEDVVDLRGQVSLAPPKGAEFGTTEVFYLTVKDRDRARAVALVDAICAQLAARYQELRDVQAQSMIDELTKAAGLAHTDLDQSVARLTGIESHVGGDLAELRILQDTGSGESGLRRTIIEIRSELRQAQTTQAANDELLRVLKEAQADPSSLVAMPGRLLESQPGLKRLKDGLLEAQLRTAELMGKMRADHPLVRAAQESEREILRHLRDELAVAIRALEIELRLSGDRLETLRQQLSAADGRLAQLAALRAPYSTQVAESQNRGELVRRAEERLAQARESQASAKAASLLSRIDSADAGIRPVGPSGLVIVLGGLAGGLLAGLGILVLSLQPATEALTYPVPVAPATFSRLSHAANGRAKNGAAAAHGSLSLKQALQGLATRSRLGR